MPPTLSIIIPAYNEGERLPATLSRIEDYLKRCPFENVEILVVDDGSRDRTADAVREFAQDVSNVRLLQNPGNRGKGYSVRHGMLEASNEWLLFTDADLSAPIEELDKLFAAIRKSDCDIAIGSRGLDRSLIGVHQPVFREKAGMIFNFVMRLTTGLPFRDTQCGFKLFSRVSARAIFARLQLERFGFDVEALFVAQRLGYRIIEVPVHWNHVDGSKVGMLQGLDGFVDILRVRKNQWLGRYR